MELFRTFGGLIVLLAMTVGVTITAAGQKSEAVMGIPTPIIVSGAPTCADLNASTNPAFAHITENWGLKVNRSGAIPYNELFTFINGPSTELQGGAGASPASRVRVAAGGNLVNWVSNRSITAVIVQGGALGANVYPYNPQSFGGFPNGDGTGLVTAGSGAGACPIVEYVTFCFQSIEPTASAASISGRVTSASGRGILGAQLTLTDPQSGDTWTAYTNSFGYFTIEGIPVGNLYTLVVSHRRHTFSDNTRTFRVDEDLHGVNFTADQ